MFIVSCIRISYTNFLKLNVNTTYFYFILHLPKIQRFISVSVKHAKYLQCD